MANIRVMKTEIFVKYKMSEETQESINIKLEKKYPNSYFKIISSLAIGYLGEEHIRYEITSKPFAKVEEL